MALLNFRSLAARDRQPEEMAQPGLDPALHRAALLALGKINRVSRTAQTYWPEIARLAKLRKEGPLRLLDVACGGGDIAVDLARAAERKGLDLEVSGCDLSSEALDRAREQAERRNANVAFFEHDITEGRPDEYDAIVCSLFLHHMDEDQVVNLLRTLSKPPCGLLLMSDLVRSRLGYLYSYVGSRCLTRSKIVHVDALLSVHAAFTITEIGRLADRAGLARVEIRRQFPQRFLLTWKGEPA